MTQEQFDKVITANVIVTDNLAINYDFGKFTFSEMEDIMKITNSINEISNKELKRMLDTGNEAIYYAFLVNKDTPFEIRNDILRKTNSYENAINFNHPINDDTALLLATRFNLKLLMEKIAKKYYCSNDYELYHAIKENFSQESIDAMSRLVTNRHYCSADLGIFLSLTRDGGEVDNLLNRSSLMTDKLLAYAISNENIPEEKRDHYYETGLFNLNVGHIMPDIYSIVNPTKHMLESIYMSCVDAMVDMRKTAEEESRKAEDFLLKMYNNGLLTEGIQKDIISRVVNKKTKFEFSLVKDILTKTKNIDILLTGLKLRSKQKNFVFTNPELPYDIFSNELFDLLKSFKANKIKKDDLTLFNNCLSARPIDKELLTAFTDFAIAPMAPPTIEGQLIACPYIDKENVKKIYQNSRVLEYILLADIRLKFWNFKYDTVKALIDYAHLNYYTHVSKETAFSLCANNFFKGVKEKERDKLTDILSNMRKDHRIACSPRILGVLSSMLNDIKEMREECEKIESDRFDEVDEKILNLIWINGTAAIRYPDYSDTTKDKSIVGFYERLNENIDDYCKVVEALEKQKSEKEKEAEVSL